MPVVSALDWNHFLQKFPNAHLLQTVAWGELKSGFGWEPVWVISNSCGAQILFRKFFPGFQLAYIPKGPIGENLTNLWDEINRVCQQKKGFLLIVEPDFWEKEGNQENQNQIKLPPGFQPGIRSIQPPRTIVVDLSDSEETMLNRMKPKTRYNIRLASRKGVVVQPSTDLVGFARMMQVTGQRDGFGVHNLAYFERAYSLFHPLGECELFVAKFKGEPIAGLMVFAHGNRSWYFYGASLNTKRELMPSYLLQWEAMLWAKRKGCETYDLWGIPDESSEKLETEFLQHDQGLWGVYRFKRGFGGKVRRSVGPWERIYKPAIYAVYRWWVNRQGVEHGRSMG